MSFFIALFSSMIINNIILSGYKGLCSYLGISKKWSSAVGMGARHADHDGDDAQVAGGLALIGG